MTAHDLLIPTEEGETVDPDDLLTPEYPDEGEVYPGLLPASSGCTNRGLAPCNCINVTGSGLHVSSITTSAKSHDNPLGRWKVTRNGNLFVRSGVVNMYPHNSWEWDHNWNFNNGDELCAGFWLSTGGWHNAPSGPACVTIHN
jgi:hypothetical protein